MDAVARAEKELFEAMAEDLKLVSCGCLFGGAFFQLSLTAPPRLPQEADLVRRLAVARAKVRILKKVGRNPPRHNAP
jgi:hypothetical protein